VTDRVIAHPSGLSIKKQSGCGFQLYTVLPVKYVAVFPEDLEYERVVQLSLGVLTASAALFNSIHLHLPLPSLSPVATGETVLIWGGSSSVGVMAIQLAIASGLEVVTTASKHNHDLLLGLGASKVFDHSSPAVVDEIVSTLKGKDASIVGAFDGESHFVEADMKSQTH
jgi:NADPH:quinone reductase-like Zn-dependent oxidoreductase